jgi:Outer membrane protein beta-barrel domain
MSFCHHRFGYLGYPLLLLTLLFAPLAVAQTDTNQPPAKPTESSSVQARIRARREQRLNQLISEIYGRKYEFYFGGGYLRFLPGDLQHVNETLWNVGFTDYLNNKWGVTGDVRGIYGTAYTYNNPNNIHLPQIYQYSFLGGPQYRFYKRPHIAVSARALAGAVYGNFNGDTRGLGSTLRLYPDGTAFGLNIGLPVDFNLSPKLAVRITPEYFLTTFGSTTQNNRGFTAGVVYRFGKR